MASLTEEAKGFIVQRLACFGKPLEIAEAVKEEFGIVIPRQQVEFYDPDKKCKVKKWVELHAATRKAFLEHKSGSAISHKAWRLDRLEAIARRAEKRNPKLAMEALEQAAKEEGDYYVNARANAPSASETEEQRVEKMRAQFDAMDAATVGAPQPPTPPKLHVA